MAYSKDINTSKLLNYSKEYLQHIDSKENREKLKALYTQTSNKITSTASAISYKAVAISSSGKLVTAYHNINSYKQITVISQEHKQYSVKVGKISIKNDFRYN